MRVPPVLVISAGVLFTSFSAILVRLSSAPPLVIAAYRMWFATLLLAPAVLPSIVRRGPEKRKPRHGSRRIFLLSILSGVFLSIHFATWVASLSYISVAAATALGSTHTLIVAAVAAALLGEHLSVRSWGFIGLAFAATLVLVVGGFGQGRPVGYLLALLGAVAVSGYMVLGRIVRQHLNARRYTLIVYGVAALLLTLYAMVAGNSLFGYSARELAIFLGLAVFCTLLGHSLYNWALRYLRTAIISTTTLLEPVIASFLAFAIFSEVPSVYTVIGGAVMLVAIFGFIRVSSRPMA